jgi:hypothetical protein
MYSRECMFVVIPVVAVVRVCVFDFSSKIKISKRAEGTRPLIGMKINLVLLLGSENSWLLL